MGIGTRVLIIFFGAALIAIGAHPLRQEYSGLDSSISKLSEDFLGQSIDFSSFKLPSEISIEVGDPDKNPEIYPRKDEKKVAAFDKINPEDRNALEELLEKLNK